MTIYNFKLPVERIKTLETEVQMYENFKKDLPEDEQKSVDFFIRHHKRTIERIKATAGFDAIYEANKDLLLPSIIEEICIKQKLPKPGVDMTWATTSVEIILREIIRATFFGLSS